MVVLGAGIAAVLGSAVFLYAFGATLIDGGPVAIALVLVPSAAVIVGVAAVIMAWSDWLSSVEITGPILRLRMFGDEKNRRYYVAVDDGSSSSIRAWRVSAARYEGLQEGEVVTVRLTRNLCCVRSVIRAEAGEGSLAPAG